MVLSSKVVPPLLIAEVGITVVVDFVVAVLSSPPVRWEYTPCCLSSILFNTAVIFKVSYIR